MLQTQPWALSFPRKRACTVPILAILGTIWAFWRFRALDGHGLALTASGRLLRGCISWSSSLASWDYRVSALGTHLRASRCRTRYSGIWGGRTCYCRIQSCYSCASNLTDADVALEPPFECPSLRATLSNCSKLTTFEPWFVGVSKCRAVSKQCRSSVESSVG